MAADPLDLERLEPLTPEQIQRCRDMLETLDAPLVGTRNGLSWLWAPADLTRLLDSHEALRAALRAEQAEVRALREQVATVLRGFDEGVFVRNTASDGDPAWAVKLLPYLGALAALAQPSSDAKEPTP